MEDQTLQAVPAAEAPAEETAEVPEETIPPAEEKNLAEETNLAVEMTAATQNRIMAEMAAVRMSLQNQ